MSKPKPLKPVLLAVSFKQFYLLKGIAEFTFKRIVMLKGNLRFTLKHSNSLKGILLAVSLSLVFGLSYLITWSPSTAYAATTNTINFQARLENASGSIVPDGTYNVEFKLYNALSSSGSSQGSCTGDAACLWHEDYLVSGSTGVSVSNGYLTVNLGSQTAFPSTIPWGQPLYLGINIGGTGSSPTWDGEMTPRLTLTAVPAAFSLESAAGSFTSTLTFVQPTASESILLPAESGSTETVCYRSDTACGFESTTGTDFIQNQNASPQTANFDITGTGEAATLEAGTFDTVTNTGLTIGSTNATGVTIGNTGLNNLTTIVGSTLIKSASGLDSNNAFQVQDSSGTVLLNADTADDQVALGTSSDDTFGNPSTSANSFDDDGIYWGGGTLQGLTAQQFTTAGGGALSSMSIYIDSSISGTNKSYQMAIYTDNAGQPGTYVASTAVGTLGSTGWNTLPITATLDPDTTYWLVYWTNTNDNTLNAAGYINEDTGIVNDFAWNTYENWQCSSGCGTSTNGMPDTYPTSGLNENDGFEESIYATFANDQPAIQTASSGNDIVSGTMLLQASTDSSTAFEVNTADNQPVLQVDTTFKGVGINTAPDGNFNLTVADGGNGNGGGEDIEGTSYQSLDVINGANVSDLDVDTVDDQVDSADLQVGSVYNNVDGAGLLFSDNFESGNFNLWSGGASGGASVDSTEPHDGRYSADINVSGSTGYARTNYSSTSTTYTVNFWMYMNTFPSSGELPIITLYQASNPNNDVELYVDSSGYLGVINGTTDLGISGNAYAADAWIPYALTVNNSTGEITINQGQGIWNDTADYTGLSIGTGWDTLQLGTSAANTGQYWVDDVAFGTGITPSLSNGLIVQDGLHISGSASFGGNVLVQPASNSATAFQVQNPSGDNLFSVDTSGDNVYLGSTGSTALASQVDIGTSSSSSNAQSVTIGSNGDTSNAVTIDGGTGASAIQIGNSNTDHGIEIGTGTGVETVEVGSDSSSSSTTIQGGTGNVYINTGAASGTSGSINITTGNSSTTVPGNVNIDTGTGVLSGTNLMDDTFEGSGSGSIDDMNADYGETGGSINASNAYANTGSYSLEIPEDSPYWGIAQNYLSLTTTPGSEYEVSAWIRGTDAETISGAMSWSNGDTTNIGPITDTSTGWTEMDGEMVAPAGATSGYLQFWSDSGNSGWTTYMDDVIVTDLSSVTNPSINIGASNAEAINIGNLQQAGVTSLLGGGGGIDEYANTGASINIGGTNDNVVNIGNSGGTVTLEGAGEQAVEILNPSSQPVLDVDTTDDSVGIGTTTPDNNALAIVGSTADNTTNALNITNNLGGSLLNVGDDGTINLDGGNSPTVMGYNTVGGTSGIGQDGYMIANQFKAPSTGSITSMSGYVGLGGGIDTTPPYNEYQYSIYTDSSGVPGSYIGSSSVGTLSSTAAWDTLSMTSPVTVTAGTLYWLVYWSNAPGTGSNNYNALSFDNTGTAVGWFSAATFGSGADNGLPATFPSGGADNVDHSIYATYSDEGLSVSSSGNVSAYDSATFEDTTNSTAAFQVQNNNGNNVLSVDTSTGTGQTILGNAGTNNGTLVFESSTSSGGSVTLKAPTITSSNSYSLTLPSTAPTTNQCLQTGSSATQLQFGACSSQNVNVSKVGEWDNHGSSVTSQSVNVSPTKIGDELVVQVGTVGSGIYVTSVTGGDVTSWQKVTNATGSDGGVDMWMGQVTSTTPSTALTANVSGTATHEEVTAIEYTASGVSSATSWIMTGSNTNYSTSTSSTVTWPSLVSAYSQEAYVGYASAGATPSIGSTPGFSYYVTGASNMLTWDSSTAVGSTYQPTTTISTTWSETIGGLLAAFDPSSIANSTTVQSANFDVQAATSGTVAGVLQGNASGTADILDIESGGGSIVDSFSSTGLFTSGMSGIPTYVAESDNEATNLNTLSITTHALGNLVALVFKLNSGNRVASVSGGDVSQWHLVTYNNGTANEEIWEGIVTTVGTATVTGTYINPSPSYGCELAYEEFSSTYGSSTNWFVTASNDIVNGSATTTITYPSLTANETGGLYFGYGVTGGTGSAGSTSGFTYKVTATGKNVLAYDTSISPGTTYSPTASTTSAVSDGVAMIAIPFSSAGTVNVIGTTELNGPITSAVTIQPAQNMESAFQILNSSGTTAFNVDTQDNIVTSDDTLQVGQGLTTATPKFLYLADVSSNSTGNPQITGQWNSAGDNWGIGANSDSSSDYALRIGTTSGNGVNTWTSTNQNINLVVAGTENVQTLTNSPTAVQVQNSSGNSVFTVDTSSNSAQGQAILGKQSTNNGTLAFDDSGDNSSVTLGTDSTGTLNVTVPGNTSSTNNLPQYDTSNYYYQTSGSGSTWTNSFTVDSNTDRYLLVNLDDNYCPTGNTETIKYAGVSMTELGSTYDDPNVTTKCDMLFGLVAPATGANNIVVTVTGTPADSSFALTASSWYHVNQTTPYGTLVTADGLPPALVDTWPAGRLVVDATAFYVGPNCSVTFDPGQGQTSELSGDCFDLDGGGDYGGYGISSKASTGKPMDMSWGGDGQWGGMAVDLIGDSGGSATFGDSATGGTTDSNDQQLYNCSVYSNSMTGLVTSLVAQYKNVSGTYDSGQAAIYSNDQGRVGALLGSSATVTIANGSNTFNLSSSVQVYSGTTYWFCSMTNTPSGGGYNNTDNMVYDSPSISEDFSQGFTYGTWPTGMPEIAGYYSGGFEIYANVTLNNPSNTVLSIDNTGQITLQNASNSSSAFQVQSASGAMEFNVDTQNDQVDIGGSEDVYIFSDTEGDTSSSTYVVPNTAASYFFFNNADGGSGTTDIWNITGLPQTEGTLVYIMSASQKSGGSGTDSVEVEINGTEVSEVSESSTGTQHMDYTALYSNGSWHIVGMGPTTNNPAGTYEPPQADYAEWIDYSGDNPPQPGDVLTVGDQYTTVKDASTPYDSSLIGVVSTSPYEVAGSDDGHSVILALTGRVPVKVSTENGPIEPGDPLTSSSVPGVAMKATQPGDIIGTALEAYDGSQDSDEITVQLHVGYDDPGNTTGGDQIQGSESITGGLTVDGSVTLGADLTVSGTTTTQDLIVGDTITATTLTVTGNAVFASIGVQTLTVNHIVTGGNPPTIKLGSAAGNGATDTITGTDSSGKIIISTGSGTTIGDLVDLTFATPYSNAPNVVVSAGDTNAAKLQQYIAPSATGFSLNAASTSGLADNQSYTFYYQVLQ